ncbi:MAG: DUF262 domain-containing protein [Actinomycetes bacterium]
MAETISFEGLMAARLLSVPDYQRAFAWGQQQLYEFWEDLDLIEPGGRHYTGTVVLRERPEPAYDDERMVSLSRADVVDGQQRLTTIVILLDTLLDRLEALGDADAASDRRRLLETTIGGVKQPKLQLGPDVRDFWVEAILGGKPIVERSGMAAEDRLIKAAAFFRDRVHDMESAAGSSAVQALRSIVGKVTGALRFTLYQVDDSAEEGVIFETLNQRGKPLTELEKAKNYLLFLASRLGLDQKDALANEINTCWRQVFVNLGHLASSHEDQFLRSHWIATMDPDPRNWRGSNSVKDRFHRRRYVGAPDALFEEVSQYVKSLRQASAAYREVVSEGAFKSFGDAALGVRLAARQLRNAGVIQIFAPLLIAARLVAPNDAEQYLRLLQICECYSVRVFLITERRGNAGQIRLYSLANDLFHNRDFEAAFNGVVDRIQYFASDEEVRTDLMNVRKNWYAKGGHKYFLYEYEVSLLKGIPPKWPFEHFVSAESRTRSTEHILPQTPTEPCWLAAFTDQQRGELTHSLGNLVLTYDNSSYSNFCFVRKRDGQVNDANGEKSACYRNSLLKQEQELADWTTWDPTAIAERQARLAEFAMARWAVPSVVAVALPSEDDVADSG